MAKSAKRSFLPCLKKLSRLVLKAGFVGSCGASCRAQGRCEVTMAMTSCGGEYLINEGGGRDGRTWCDKGAEAGNEMCCVGAADRTIATKVTV